VKDRNSAGLLLFTVYLIYFICGMAMCFEGAFMPEFKEHFHLNYQQQMYIMFAKNIPFVIFSILIGLLSKKIGFKNCLTVALFLFAAGTALLIPGLLHTDYYLLLTGFFILGIAFNLELVAGNPLLLGLGDSSGSSSRLNLGNALGAIAQIIAPIIIILIVPATVVTISGRIPYINGIFIAIAIILAFIGILTLMIKDIRISSFEKKTDENSQFSGLTIILKNKKLLLGFLAIFLTLGTEAGIFGLYRNYVEDLSIAGLSSRQSYTFFTIYFAVFAAGRLTGAYVQRRAKPAITLVYSTIIAMILLLLMITVNGNIALISVTLIGFFISIFFPTLYAISIEGFGSETGLASGFLTMGFLGAAVIPVLQGKLADLIGLKYSFLIGIAAYGYVLYYSLLAIRWGKNRNVG
jgi:FHS family L-fucose permease-like MFS transporter